MFRKLLAWVAKDETGASIVEYAFLVILIAILALVAVRLAGNEVSASFSEIASHVANA